MKKLKVIILTEIISPYRIPPFNCLAQDADIELEVFFLAETESRRSWQVSKQEIQFTYRVLWGLQVGKAYQSAPTFLNPGVIYQLRQQKPDVIICGGWHHYTYWLALVYAQLTRTRFLIWSESTLKDERSDSRYKEALKRWIVSKTDGYIVPGKAQRDYLQHLGANKNSIWIAPNAVDHNFFVSETERYRQNQELLKHKLGMQGLVILCVSRLIDEKGIPELLEAFAQLSQDKPVNLVIAGDGPQAQQYYLYCQENRLSNVVFTGFQPQSTLVQYYAIADIFVFPTRSDTWGLVLNEAMTASLPIICSATAGAVEDLVEDQANGFIVPVKDAARLSQALQCLIADEALRKKMGVRSHQIISNYTPEKMAQGLKQAIQQATSTKKLYLTP
ncbi:glycosyltransferase family 4 protein [Nostoc sp. PCC 7107]|uniref:glycosyltransferase family 4 protein n=1 Tax=Nostoc sp. PCC 7107 TaxID=317936 RepID=UPI00029F1E8C|nr:glycosyltransferase family 4 protein [Nostoc sp. PCC 7107]AFY43909.1 glycosyl transferase group 1 [Nostoc sp. PCC 7107]